MKKEEEEKDDWKLDDFPSPCRIFSPLCSDDEHPIFGTSATTSFLDTFNEDLNLLGILDIPGSPILPIQNPIPHRRTRTQPTPTIPQPLTEIAPKTSKSIYHFTPGQNSRNCYMPNATLEDNQFIQICNDKNRNINPHQLGFIPHSFWPDQTYQFGVIVRDFFHRKNHPSGRFSHKLYNALKLTESDSSYFKFTGVEWKSKEVLHVDKNRFARLLGIKSVDGSLFHQQGNFPSFGFVELSMEEIKKQFGDDMIKNSDIEVDRYLIHSPGVFVSNCSEQDIADDIKWKGVRQRAISLNCNFTPYSIP